MGDGKDTKIVLDGDDPWGDGGHGGYRRRRDSWSGDEGEGDPIFGFPKKQTVAERKEASERELGKLRQGAGAEGEPAPRPLRVGRGALAKSPWGKAWCGHIADRCDYESRLPAGRSYLYSGAVVDLRVESCRVLAKVIGTRLYRVEIKFTALDGARQACIVARCGGGISSVAQLVGGELSPEVLSVLTDAEEGLFPGTGGMSLSCDCPDWATMCKHVAAVLYGIGYRIDEEPIVLFELRGVDPGRLLQGAVGDVDVGSGDGGLGADGGAAKGWDGALGDIFGIEIEGL